MQADPRQAGAAQWGAASRLQSARRKSAPHNHKSGNMLLFLVQLICFGLGLIAPRSHGEMYTSLLNVKESIGVERTLITSLRTYIDHELERLEDVKR